MTPFLLTYCAVMWDGQSFRRDDPVPNPQACSAQELDWVQRWVTRFLSCADPASRFEIEVQW